MSEGESFLARWARVKREQQAADAGTDDAQPPVADLASLPAIESIGAGSDISGYLLAGVPAELTQAALRSAWRTDPVIREFVEMADNQWDFNTPEAIPGFGVLGPVEEAKALVARAATGAVEQTATALASLTDRQTGTMLASVESGSDRAENQVVSGVALEDSRVADSVWRAGIVPLADDVQAAVAAPVKQLESDLPTPSRRLHGSALPKSE
jgi:hypothetical protein